MRSLYAPLWRPANSIPVEYLPAAFNFYGRRECCVHIAYTPPIKYASFTAKCASRTTRTASASCTPFIVVISINYGKPSASTSFDRVDVGRWCDGRSVFRVYIHFTPLIVYYSGNGAIALLVVTRVARCRRWFRWFVSQLDYTFRHNLFVH